MFSNIRKRITYTNMAVTVALVFLMTGGAYAAKKYIITSTKQISPTVLKQLASKQGPAGTKGDQGPAGPKGEPGPTGTEGKQGPKGDPGPEGKQGTEGKLGPIGPKGTNGQDGKEGPEGQQGPLGEPGQPWTPNGTLPSGATETGAWSASGTPTSIGVFEAIMTSISFTIPLKTVAAEHVIGVGEEGTGEGCPAGSSATKPAAEPGNLCIFTTELHNALGPTFVFNPELGIPKGLTGSTGKTGAGFLLLAENPGSLYADGTWALTAGE